MMYSTQFTPKPALPFPDIPYGTAPAWTFGIAEWSLLLLLLLCGIHAARSEQREGRGALPYLLGGFLFGLMLEYIEVLSHSYTYGHFHWMLGRAPLDIPVCIGAGWGIVLYSSRLFSDSLGLPLAAAAALDTLLALNVDLSMDVVAYRLHMWHWYWAGTGLHPLRAQWFGVPYGNFVGWATVVFCYSAFSRLWEKKLLPVQADMARMHETGPSPQAHSERGVLRFTAVAIFSLLCSQAVLFTLETWGHGHGASIFSATVSRVACENFARQWDAGEWRGRHKRPLHFARSAHAVAGFFIRVKEECWGGAWCQGRALDREVAPPRTQPSA